MLTVPQACQQIRHTLLPATPVRLPLSACLGLPLAEPITAQLDSPPFDKSLMDGFAVRASDFTGPGTTFAVIERLTAGQVATQEVSAGQAIQVMTGTQLPPGADAIIRVEEVVDPAANPIQGHPGKLFPGRDIMRRGESMTVGETVLAAGTRLNFPQLGLLAELGETEIAVFPRPRVAILATGNELVPLEQTPGPGQIRNSNELMLTLQAQTSGAIPVPLGIARDEPNELRDKIEQGLQADFLILSGGVSAGVLDLVPQTLQQAGVQEVFHHVQVKPGKPIWFGIRPATAQQSACYVFGLPGNPVSSLVCWELFVRWGLHCFQTRPATGATGEAEAARDTGFPGIPARLSQPHLVKGDRPVYYPAQLHWQGPDYLATPTRWVGSADLRGTAEANGMIHFPPREAPYEAGEMVQVFPWTNPHCL